MDFINPVIEQWLQQSLAEAIAVLLAVVYVYLAAIENKLCWIAGFASTALFSYVYFDVSLVFQTLLNFYYMAMAVWGMITWSRQGEQKLFISNMPVHLHLVINLLAMGLIACTYFMATIWLQYELILLDISITVFSLLATYLTVRKYIESWYYWSMINVATIFLVWPSELYLTACLMVIYVLIAIKGLLGWSHELNMRKNKVAHSFD